eukprot:TRINITY_DN16411_c0_g1::TRINITY_DN16411_c0_g1_i1::g.29546::m.29546 TRINITY_DN16411_c0_g1::TRINITY_DN16411_c0_g1_i1::g.29546  ORF type:complete len:414 (+),score=90.30,sp/Q99J08/S14L2_MOUSE/28.61/3e-42,CRAL_TRIO/PF00650.15/2.3e-32,GOLD_2/PF13897.1/2.2,GOLD_2/PF13897.1/3.2e-05,CRAL_TRIO_N/PF03765.10/9.4e-05,CRAL_TRIO_N/PF03765.10/2.8e+02,Sec3-PIP2_bind/PF15277.1/5.4e+03,Sec3-PIP2_bind/PF15277.1/0.15 TRINITY_DN16411_c0_g1_i1:49-1242(+)
MYWAGTGVTSEQQANAENLKERLAHEFGSVEKAVFALGGKPTVELPDHLYQQHIQSWVYRFLRARLWDVDQTLAMIHETVKWREHNKCADLMSFQEPLFLSTYYPCCYHKTDKEGRPIKIERVGTLDVGGLLANLPETPEADEMFLRFQYKKLEHAYSLKDQATVKTNKMIDGVTAIMDLDGLSTGHLHTRALHLLKMVSAAGQDNFPEGLYRMYIVRAPRIFSMAWKVISPVLNERTQRKIHIVGDDWKDKLLDIIAPENLPVELGGSCRCPGGCVPSGGPIPHHFTAEKAQAGGPFDVTVHHGCKFHHSIRVPKGHSVCWKFHTKSNNIQFAVDFYADNNPSVKTIVPAEKVESQNTNIEGERKADEDGTFILTFDNTYSWTKSKDLQFQVYTKP